MGYIVQAFLSALPLAPTIFEVAFAYPTGWIFVQSIPVSNPEQHWKVIKSGRREPGLTKPLSMATYRCGLLFC